jgi:hypothetical protein
MSYITGPFVRLRAVTPAIFGGLLRHPRLRPIFLVAIVVGVVLVMMLVVAYRREILVQLTSMVWKGCISATESAQSVARHWHLP